MSAEKGYSLDNGKEVVCLEVVRSLPGKRLVFLGEYEGEKVFAKLYLDAKRGETHWRRELDGLHAFKDRSIVTAEILYAGKSAEQGFPIIILEQLHGAVSVKQAWSESDDTTREQILQRMVLLLARHHRAGLCQTDLHLDNFVISQGQIYSLDGAGVSVVEGELGLTAGLDNLALFLAQFLPVWTGFAPALYDLYLEQRGIDQGPGIDWLLQQIEQAREWRWSKFKGKLFRDCTAIRYSESASRLEIVARRYASPELDHLLEDPDASFPGRERALKNGSSCTVWATHVGDLSVVIKRYNGRGWLKGLLRKVVRSRALISWENAHLLVFYGISTPLPVAVLEQNGVCGDGTSYFLTEEINGICLYYWLLDEARSETDLKIMAKKVIAVFVQLYTHRLTHGDMKIANWFVVDDEVVLIDLDSMKKHQDGPRFRWLWRSDVRRFMRNWKDLPELFVLFGDEFEAQGLKWK